MSHEREPRISPQARELHEAVQGKLKDKEIVLMALAIIDNVMDLQISATGNPAHTKKLRSNPEQSMKVYQARREFLSRVLVGEIPSIEELDTNPNWIQTSQYGFNLGWDIDHILRLAPPILKKIHASGISLAEVGEERFREFAREAHRADQQEAEKEYLS